MGVLWKTVKTGLYTPPTHKTVLPYFMSFFMSLFSYAIFLHPFPLNSKHPSESQCHRDPGPQLPLGKWKTKWITNSISIKTVSEPDWAQICSESSRHCHTNDFAITILGFWVHVGSSSETWTSGRQWICYYANSFRCWKREEMKRWANTDCIMPPGF